MNNRIKENHPDLYQFVEKELHDQRHNLKMIASENYSSLDVQAAQACILQDKYAEGYPFHRFYAGCDNVDEIEYRACELACQLFNAEHAYVQPHSGADANLCAYWAILDHKITQPFLKKHNVKSISNLTEEEFDELRELLHSQKLLGMDYYSGGHLTHGYKQNISAQLFKAYSYSVGKDGLLDYDEIEKKAEEVKPLILLAGYSAYPGKIDFRRMESIALKVGAVLMVDMAHFAGLVAGKVFTEEYDPVKWADVVTSTTHKTLRGPRGGLILCKEEFAESVDRGCPLVIGGPLAHVILAKAICFKEALTEDYKKYAQNIVNNSKILAEELEKRGVQVATHTTKNHIVLIDLSNRNVNGRQAESALRECGITCNRNALPNDINGPWYTSGIRLGTAALTTLGMGKEEMIEIADIISTIIHNIQPVPSSRTKYILSNKEDCVRRVQKLLEKFPLYEEEV